jgi:hypothetical protein
MAESSWPQESLIVAAQEALIVLYRKIGTLRASGALVSWMFRIVRNECGSGGLKWPHGWVMP